MNHICTKCQLKNATVHYKENVNGKTKEYFLCSDCAEKMGLGSPSGFFAEELLGNFPLFSPVKKESAAGEVCSVCGLDWQSLRRGGRFGCSACYDAFASRLDMTPFVGKGYGGARLGEKPCSEKKEEKAPTPEEETAALRERLQKALAQENYEEAALLRDQIREREGA